MTDFIYDGTDLPDGKTDARPLTGVAGQNITAAEWNTLCQAVIDGRSAMLAGQFHGLVSAPSAPVSSASGVRLRNRAGVLQASENGGMYRAVMGAELQARDYGVVADGVTDDSAALQAAVNAAVSLQRPLRLAKGVHLVNTRVNLAGTITMLGTARDGGGGGTVIKAGASMETVVYGQQCSFSSISGIEFDGGGLANCGLRLGSCSLSVFDRCRFTNALYDGVRVPRYLIDGVTFGLSDTNHFLNCDGYRNGTLFGTSTMLAIVAGLNVRSTTVTGTVACTIGSNIVTGTGTSFLSMGLRMGDFIRIGAGSTPQYLQVHTVESDTQITCGNKQLATQSLSGQDFMIGRGAGYFEEYGPDTNVNRVTGGIWRSNAACGIQLGGLYGGLVDNAQVDTHPLYGIAVNFSAEDTQTFATTILHAYLEGNEAAPFYLGAAYGISIIDPMVYGIVTPIHYSQVSSNFGTWLDGEGIAAVGNGSNRMPTLFGANFANSGKYRQSVGGVSTTSPGGTIDYDSAILQVATGGDVAYTSTPTLAAGTLYGQRCRLINVSASAYTTIDDFRKRANTKLRLKTPSVKLGPGDSVDLIWDETYWTEIGRSIAAVVNNSPTAGAITVNELQGRAKIAAGASSVVITNNQVNAGDLVSVTFEDLDTTATVLKAVATSNTITITANANATADCTVNFLVRKQSA